nr:MAG TPA: hypothetical protein [Caudoviricetes sp.]
MFEKCTNWTISREVLFDIIGNLQRLSKTIKIFLDKCN